MAKRSESARALAAYRERIGIPARAAARELRVTHPAILSWESGDRIPSPEYREAMQRWSRGEIRADGWGLTKRMLRLQQKVAEVVERPEEPDSTGTDST